MSSNDSSLDPRLLIAISVGLVLTAVGGFYFALGPRPGEPLPAPAVSSPPAASAPSNAAVSDSAVAPTAPPQPAAPASQTAAPSLPSSTPASPPPPAPPLADAASIEAEIALSEFADVLAFVKKNFPAEYNDLIDNAVRRRNAGVSEQVFGQELANGVQNIMRGKLKYGAGASLATMDKLAANEASLFHGLGTEAADSCLKMLGMDDKPPAGAPPQNIRQLMQLGTLYRFQAIAEGLPNTKAITQLSKDELQAYEASVVREGLDFKDMNSGAFLRAGGPGKPCLMLETLHLAISRLTDDTRRKIYAGMFFLGRDR